MIIDKLLDKITMYRLTLYYLLALLLAAAAMALVGLQSFTPWDVLASTVTALVVSAIANYVFAELFGAVTNVESVFITALILVLIIPVAWPQNLVFLAVACVLAMGSKYLLTVEKQHVFNPAAIAVAGVALLFPQYAATWWAGTPYMTPLVVIGGWLLVRKIRREPMVYTFLGVYLVAIVGASLMHSGLVASLLLALQASITHSAMWFLGLVMLTEPLTSPTEKKYQYMYAAGVAVLTATPQLRLGGLAFTPELALSIGNIFTYFVTARYRFVLVLREKIQLTSDTLAYVFDHVDHFPFRPGQYMEWTLPHPQSDSRGNRRYFSLASSPSEEQLVMAVKFYNQPSTYKQALYNLQPGQEIIASQLAGDFVLPKKLKKPLVFIAGGIGITPFRSMVQDIVDQKKQCDIVLLYSNNQVGDIVFTDTFEAARPFGVKTVYTLTDTKALPSDWQGKTGYITEEMIKEEVPDYANRTFYVSGPQLMVRAMEELLKKMGIPEKQVIMDYFPGFG